MNRESFKLITRETRKYLKDPNFVVFGYVQDKLDLDKKALTAAVKDALDMSVTKVALNFPKTDLEYIIIHSRLCYAWIRPDRNYHSGKLFVAIENYEPHDDNQSMLPSPPQYTIEAKTENEFYHAFVRIHNILTFNDAAVKARAELDDMINTVTRDDVEDPVLKKGIV